MRPAKSRSWFTSFAKWTAHATGRPATFALAAGVSVVWAATGPLFGFSDTWQLVINLAAVVLYICCCYVALERFLHDDEAIAFCPFVARSEASSLNRASVGLWRHGG